MLQKMTKKCSVLNKLSNIICHMCSNCKQTFEHHILFDWVLTGNMSSKFICSTNCLKLSKIYANFSEFLSTFDLTNLFFIPLGGWLYGESTVTLIFYASSSDKFFSLIRTWPNSLCSSVILVTLRRF